MARVYFLTPALRTRLKRPLGKLYSRALALKSIGKKPLITVGDIATLLALRNGKEPWIAFTDGKCQRRPLALKQKRELGHWKARKWSLRNPHGTLSEEAFRLCRKLFSLKKERHWVRVKGEEDLLLLPCMRWAPLETLLFYGQPRRGGVLVGVTKAARIKAGRILNQFSKTPPGQRTQ